MLVDLWEVQFGGDYVKEYAKTGIPTDKEIEVRKTYSEVRRK